MEETAQVPILLKSRHTPSTASATVAAVCGAPHIAGATERVRRPSGRTQGGSEHRPVPARPQLPTYPSYVQWYVRPEVANIRI